jgi:hypothetical protein
MRTAEMIDHPNASLAPGSLRDKNPPYNSHMRRGVAHPMLAPATKPRRIVILPPLTMSNHQRLEARRKEAPSTKSAGGLKSGAG